MTNTSVLDNYVGSRIRERRKQLKLSQSELADILGISYQQVQKYESGQTQITLSRLFQIARALNANPAYFHEGAPLETNSPNVKATTIITHPRVKKLEILLVEDSAGDELLFRKAVERFGDFVNITSINQPEKVMGYIATCGSNHTSALPDLAVMDINMPKISGLDLLKSIKNSPATSHIPVVMLTNSVRVDEMEKCYKLQASSFIQKPASFDDYEKVVSNVVEYWSKTAVLPTAH